MKKQKPFNTLDMLRDDDVEKNTHNKNPPKKY